MMPQLGCQMGECQIIQGDARNLENILVDHAIFSPPYAEALMADKDAGEARIKRLRASGHNGMADRIEKAHNWHQHEADYNPNNQSNIANLPYGDIASIITSPPYAIEKTSGGLNTKPAKNRQQGNRNPNSPSQLGAKEGYGDSEEIGRAHV